MFGRYSLSSPLYLHGRDLRSHKVLFGQVEPVALRCSLLSFCVMKIQQKIMHTLTINYLYDIHSV